MKSRRTCVTLGLVLGSIVLLAWALFLLAAPPAAVAMAEQIESAPPLIDDFESGMPAGWYWDADWANTVMTTTVVTQPHLTIPGQVTNSVFSLEFVSGGWGGTTGHNLPAPQDWSAYDGVSFWLYGTNSGTSLRYTLTDDGGEGFEALFTDNVAGWKLVSLPWQAFTRAGWQPPGAPDDGLTLTAVSAYGFFMIPGTSGHLYFDQVKLFETPVSLIDDFESGMPAGWYWDADWANTVMTTTVVTQPHLTIPGQVTNSIFSLEFVSGGWGGTTGHNLPAPQNWSAYDGVSFWLYGTNSGTSLRYTLTDDGGEGFEALFTDNVAGWKLVSLPWQAFTRAGWQPPGAPDDGLTLTAVSAYGFFMIPGTSGHLYFDQVRLFETHVNVIDDFESGVPAGWYWDADWANTVMTTTVVTQPHLTIPGQVTNSIFSLEFVSGGWGGTTGHNLPAPQNWSAYDGVSFWLYGTNSGTSLRYTLTDDGGEGFEALFTDNVAGWKLVSLPWQAFTRAGWQPPGAPDDGLTLTAVSAYGFFMIPGTSGHLYFDQVAVFDPQATFYIDQIANPPGIGESAVNFSSVTYGVEEGDQATISVELTAAASEPVTVTYATADGTALAGVDYVAVSGTLVFPVDTLVQTFTVQTIDNELYEGSRSLSLILSDPVNAALGPRDQATLTIMEDDLANVCAQRATTVDDFEDGQLPYGLDGDGIDIGFFTWVGPNSTVTITTTQMATDTVLQMDSQVVDWGGVTHHFENQAVDTWVPQDWSSYAAVSFWVYGTNSGQQLLFEIQDNRNPGSTADDTEIWSYSFLDNFAGWKRFEVMFTEFNRKDIGNGAPNDGFTLTEVHGWAFGSTGVVGTLFLDDVQICGFGPPPELQVAFDLPQTDVVEADTAVITVELNVTATHPVTVSYRTAEGYATPDRDYTPVSGTVVIAPGETTATFEVPTLGDSKYEGDENLMLVLSDAISATLGFQRRAVLNIVDDDAMNPGLLDDFEGYHPYQVSGPVTLAITEILSGTGMALPGQGSYENVLEVAYDTTSRATGDAGFSRSFVESQDWSAYEGLSFWYYGTNSGETISVEVLDNQITTTADVDPADWELVWSDEFDEAAGTPPNSNTWKYEIGDGTLNGIPGWGNSELEYYTDSPDNAATDGAGNLVITLSDVNTSTTELQCWYGPCENTSARLISEGRAEFAYGRVESRIQVPTGPAGLWPAFWMLGTDIGDVGWPQCGEIDIMEYVSRLPDEVFGTIHGPGYSGGASFGNTYIFTEPVSNTFHTFAIEWQPDHIDWYVDGILYHTAEPGDVAPNEWVYNHPFYIILNLAIGGNFGGLVSEDMTYPQEMLVDYVRVYGAADTAERFEANFVDDFAGWKKIIIPFDDFVRSADQPAGAPDDGLGLTEVWGYGLLLPEGSSGTFYLDQVSLVNLTRIYLPLIKTD